MISFRNGRERLGKPAAWKIHAILNCALLFEGLKVSTLESLEKDRVSRGKKDGIDRSQFSGQGKIQIIVGLDS
jgi:hypothetical protein